MALQRCQQTSRAEMALKGRRSRMAHPYLVANSLFSMASGLVALAVSYYAFRYRRVTSSGFLRIISLGFMLLGVGLLTQASVFIASAYNVARIADRVPLIYDATIVYLLLQGVAYFMILVGYTKRLEGPAIDGLSAPAFVGGVTYPLLFGTYLLFFGELGILVLLALVTFQAALVYGEAKGSLSLAVLSGFAFILIAHLGELASVLSGSWVVYLLGDVAQLVGFALLLLFVVWSGKVGPA